VRHLSDQFPIWLCDIWGVVHNGVRPFPTAVDALINHRKNGGHVILISNAPNTSSSVVKHMTGLGVNPQCFDGVVTSGDATRDLIIKQGGYKTYHIGTSRDYSIFEGLSVVRAPLSEAQSVTCSGLFNENTETAEDYAEIFKEMKQRNLPMICANPDKVVQKGNRLVPCAGALAQAYAAMGGKVLMAGKPFAPIYQLAIEMAARVAGHALTKAQILAIGDGPATDIQGAADLGVPCVFITGGINSGPDIAARVQKAIPQAKILRSMVELDWT
jgi:HAD superfamily hydrolase (TIGR01459 family)